MNFVVSKAPPTQAKIHLEDMSSPTIKISLSNVVNVIGPLKLPNNKIQKIFSCCIQPIISVFIIPHGRPSFPVFVDFFPPGRPLMQISFSRNCRYLSVGP